MSASRFEPTALLPLRAMADAKEGGRGVQTEATAILLAEVPGDLPDFYPCFAEKPFDENYYRCVEVRRLSELLGVTVAAAEVLGDTSGSVNRLRVRLRYEDDARHRCAADR